MEKIEKLRTDFFSLTERRHNPASLASEIDVKINELIDTVNLLIIKQKEASK